MSDGTGISWTDATWPVVTGCTHLSSGCDHCYAAKLTSGRLKHLPAYAGLAEDGRFNGQVRLLPDRLGWPLRWRKPRKVFVSDMGDLFHQDVPDEFIAQVFGVMAATPRHTYQVLTKRHARMRSLLSNYGWWTRVVYYALGYEDHPGGERRGPTQTQPDGCALLNVWLGVSAEDQRWADIRIPALLETPAAVRFASCEPLLGFQDLTNVAGINALDRDWVGGPSGGTGAPHPLLSWVIAGGESGPGHRPMEIRWLESIVDQCTIAGVPVWVKQDSGPRAGQQGRIPDELWIKQFPRTTETVPA